LKLFGLFVVKNESDIIDEVLSHLQALACFDTIFFFDLGSTDDTFAKALAYRDILHEPQILDRHFSERMRIELLLEHAHHFRAGDWLSVIDADEFYVDDPWDLIAVAEQEGADSIHTYQAQFYLTDADLQNEKAIEGRRRHYLINWSEARFFKYRPEKAHGAIQWVEPCSRRLLNRH
jgi:glycosyltransferase involved in cell wall biosynthesis